MTELIKKYKRRVLFCFLCLASLLALFCLYQDIQTTSKYMMSDFRSRVVAARLLEDGTDPYFYKWSPGEPVTYLDPCDFPIRPMSRVTVPPTTLLINTVFDDLSYGVQKTIWLIFQWATLLFSLIFLSKSMEKFGSKLLIWIIGLAVFGASWMWRFHVNAGQLYMFYVMLLSAGYFALKRSKRNDSFFAGIIIGFTASMRPNAILFLIPAFIAGKFKTLVGAVVGFGAMIGLALSVWGVSPWLSYFNAIRLHEWMHLGWLENAVPNSLVYNFSNVEGLTDFHIIPRFLYSDSSLQLFFQNNSSQLIPVLAAVMLIYMIFLFVHRSKLENPELLAFAGITAVIISEFYLPAARYSYYDVIWLLPLGLMLKMIEGKPTGKQIVNFTAFLFAAVLMSLGEIVPQLALVIPHVLCIMTVWLSTVMVRQAKYSTEPVRLSARGQKFYSGAKHTAEI